MEPGAVVPKVVVEFRSGGKRIDKPLHGMLWSYHKGQLAPRRFEVKSGILSLDKLQKGRYPISTTSGDFVLEVRGAQAVVELGDSDLSVSGKPGTRVRFYRSGSDLLVRTLSGRVPGSWNRIPASGTLHLPYLRPGQYDICVGDMNFRKRQLVTGTGTQLKLD